MDDLERILHESTTEKGIQAPATLRAELAAHLRAFPHDSKFEVNVRDGDGYGTATCMEDSCYCDVALGPNSSPDGGAAQGFGTLTAYGDHIKTSAAHRAERDTRVFKLIKKDPAPVSAKAISTPSADRKPSRLDILAAAEQRNSKTGSPIASGSGSSVNRKPIIPRDDVNPVIRDAIVGRKPIVDRKPVFGKKVAPPLKRSSSAGGLSDDAGEVNKKLKVGHGVLGDGANHGNAGAGNPQQYAELIKKVRDQEAQWNTYLSALRALPEASKNEEYCAKIDQGNVALMSLAKQKQDMQDRFGPPLPTVEDAYGKHLAAMQKMQAIAAAGPSGGAAGPMMDHFERSGVPGQVDYDEDGVAHIPSSEEFDEFLKLAAEGSEFEGNKTVDVAAEALGLSSQHDLIPGMSIPLMPHQLIGVSWMAEQEDSKNYGGVLADEMGLGKTVQTIAIMCKNGSKDPAERTNLIVAPLALLAQWMDEIESKTVAKQFSVLIHHGPTKVKTKKELARYDVVLTTYHTLAGEWPDEEKAMKDAKKGRKDGEDPDDFVVVKNAGPLFQLGFFRVILDEAQNIRNKSTKISRAVAQLDSLYRWALTGTPITNQLGDVFPLLRFLQIKPFYAWADFRNHVVVHEKKRPDLAGCKTQAILRTCLLRRKKDSKLDGKELITLPPKTTELRVLEFTDEEREIYTFVETRSQATFNKYLRQGTVLRNFAHVLVMLLRLRQICFHPCLISEGYEALAIDAKDEKVRDNELLRATTVVNKDFVAKIRKMRMEKAMERIAAEKESEDALVDDDDCPVCMEPFVEGDSAGIVTKCCHAFCRGCIDEVLQKDAIEDDDPAAPKHKADERPCPTCRAPISKTFIFQLDAFEPTEAEIAEQLTGEAMDVDEDEVLPKKMVKVVDEDDEEPTDAGPIKVKQNNRAVIRDSDDEEEAKEKEKDEFEDKKPKMSAKKAGKQRAPLPGWMAQQEPSTKMKWMLDEILRVRAEQPDDKFLIISSFTTALELVDDYLRSNNVSATRYQGDMTRLQRDESVRILGKSKKCFIMLMSLKCGGVGLNLVRANHVINLDLAWSHAVEQQAFDRCHRIGQLKPVNIDRLTIARTVEQRIGEMQERKKALADASLGEGTGVKLGRLSVAELAGLFGLTATGARMRT